MIKWSSQEDIWRPGGDCRWDSNKYKVSWKQLVILLGWINCWFGQKMLPWFEKLPNSSKSSAQKLLDKNILPVKYVIAKVESKKTYWETERKKYSLIIDESTDIGTLNNMSICERLSDWGRVVLSLKAVSALKQPLADFTLGKIPVSLANEHLPVNNQSV